MEITERRAGRPSSSHSSVAGRGSWVQTNGEVWGAKLCLLTLANSVAEPEPTPVR